MKTATLEELNEGELIFGSLTAGRWFSREYEDDEETGGQFFKTEEEGMKYYTESGFTRISVKS